MKEIKIRSLKTNDILRAIPITSSNIADFLENGYNIGIGDWIIVGPNGSWKCTSNEFKNHYEIIEPVKREDTMKTKNFTVTGMTVNSSYDIMPSINIEVSAESLDFANDNKVVTAEKLKDIIESKLNNTFSVVPPIKKVIFNNPATIVFWTDGTKTVVKCAEGDTFSEYAELSMCIAKKLLGNDFKKEMNKWCKSGDKPKKETSVVDGLMATRKNGILTLIRNLKIVATKKINYKKGKNMNENEYENLINIGKAFVNDILHRDDELCHWGIKGMKWGVRRYQNSDGTLTPAGKKRYSTKNNFKLEKTGNRYTLENRDGKIAAEAQLFDYSLKGFDWMLLANVETKPEYRRQGFASRLINKICQDVYKESDGAKGVYLLVKTNNMNAINLYNKLGFETAKNYRIGKQDYYIMAKGNADKDQIKRMNFS